MMRILALETSTEFCSVALWQDGAVTSRCELVGQKHSELLMAMLDGVMRDADLRVQDLHGIAFGMGPGSFTGIRIACGVAQGLALGAALPVFGVCTLQALAQATGSRRVVAALDARMGEIYHAAYQRHEGGWLPVSMPRLCRPGDAPALPGNDWVGAGSGFAMYGAELSALYAGQLRCVDAALVPKAAAMAELGVTQFMQGLGVDAAQALPLYLRDKVALKTGERERC